ncbi:MAG: LLM class flavin-dependent oxidoreductase [Dehalococcoidia bacterium]
MQQTQRPIRVGLGTPQAGPNATAEFIRDFVTQARSCGIGAFWVGEHIVMGNFRHRAKVTETFLDPLALLAFIAGMDGQVELGTSVLVVPYRNPLVLLKGICTIAHLTGRRFTIGVGAGWAEEGVHDPWRRIPPAWSGDGRVLRDLPQDARG